MDKATAIRASRAQGRYLVMGGKVVAGTCPLCGGYLAQWRDRRISKEVDMTGLRVPYEVTLVKHLDDCPDDDILSDTLGGAIRVLRAEGAR